MVHVVQAEGRDARARYRLSVREVPPVGCLDGLGTPEQVGGALNLGGSAIENQWSARARDNGLCLHENQLWAVHVDVDQPGDPSTRTQNGPYVQRWTGAVWEDMAFPAVDPSERPDRVAIVSDNAGSVFIAFSRTYFDCDIPVGCSCPGTCANIFDDRDIFGWSTKYVEVWRWDGAWTVVADYPIGGVIGFPGGAPAFRYDDHCRMIFYSNTDWTAQKAQPDFVCGGNSFGGGDMDPIYLGAQNGSHVVVWQETGKLVETTVDNTGCIADVCHWQTDWTQFDYAGVFSGTDGNDAVQLTSEAGNGIIDLIWDADSGAPLLSWTDGDIADARDGSLIQNIADGETLPDGRRFGVLFSNAYAGKRYLLGTQDPLGAYVWETSPDGTAAAGPLDGWDGYANGVEIMPSLGFRIIAEQNNLWQLGAIGRGCAGTGDAPCNGNPAITDAVMSSAVFTRLCTDNCPPEGWYGISGDAFGRSVEDTSNYTQLKFGEALYGIVRTRDLSETYGSEHRVYRVPILRCATQCHGPPFIQGQSFLTGQHFDEGSGTQNWGVVTDGVFDRVKFYVDNVLVWTADGPGAGPWYYNDTPPGAYDVGALAVGDHQMKVVAELDECGPAGPPLSDTDVATITIDTPGAKYGHLTVRIDGVDQGTSDISGLNVTELKELWVGNYIADLVNDHLIDDVLVGTSGYGSSDVFSADFSASIVPPFDSEVNGAGLSISGGQLHVDTASADAYAVKDLSFSGDDLYIQFKVTTAQAEWDNDSFTGDFVVITRETNAVLTGIYIDVINAEWLMDGPGPTLTATPAPSVQYTVDLHFSKT